jgi:hypothetical protein
MYGMGMFSPQSTPNTTSVNTPEQVYAFQQQMGMAPK